MPKEYNARLSAASSFEMYIIINQCRSKLILEPNTVIEWLTEKISKTVSCLWKNKQFDEEITFVPNVI